MSQSFIDAIMHFLALLYLPLPDRRTSHLKSKLEDYIEKAGILFPAEDCLRVFNSYSGKYFLEFTNRSYEGEKKLLTAHHQMIIEAARRAQMNLYLRERYLLILALAEFSGFYNPDNQDVLSDIKEIALNLNIPPKDFDEAMRFLFHRDIKPDKSELRIEESNEDLLEGSWIEQHKQEIDIEDRHILSRMIKGKLFIKYFDKYHLFALKYLGTQTLFVNEKKVYPEYFYSFGQNVVLQFEGGNRVFFEDFAGHFNLKYNLSRIKIQGENLEYSYPYSGYAVRPFSFSEDAGQLIGIVGNNGVGKSTILKLIAGIHQPSAGDVLINGASLLQNKFKLQSVIGFVSHENMFFDELTVYENVFYHAQLCMGDLKAEELHKRTKATIAKFDLQDVSHIKPSEFEKKRISDFDRVSLNIAIELIREPYILCLDEPFLGLPYADAKRLLNILKEETFEGKIIFISVHLPTPEIYNLFDKVWFIDQGGYVIFQGGPKVARDYFNSSGIIPFHIVSAREDIVSPEEIISLVETKKVRPDGVISDDRLVEPEKWYLLFRKKQMLFQDKERQDKPLPVKPSSVPGIEKQFFIHLLRLFKIRFSSLNYLLLTFAGIPVIGSAIAFITRYSAGTEYYFGENKYFPVFLFLSVSFLFFAGLLNGAEEIIKEKARNQRDKNLNLSYFSYINSKTIFIAVVSLIQSVLFTLLSTLVLKIEGMFLTYTVVFFSLLVFAGLFSLILSSALRHISSVYILIPFIIIPNLIFSGFLISYSDYPVNLKGKIYRAVSDIVPTRWGFEALMVESYTKNMYNRHFFNDRFSHYQMSFFQEELVPILFDNLDQCMHFYNNGEPDSLEHCLRLLRKEILQLSEMEYLAPFESFSRLNPEQFNESLFNELFGYFTYLTFYFESEIKDVEMKIQFKEELMSDDSSYITLKAAHHNSAVDSILTQGAENSRAIVAGNQVEKYGAPVFMIPDNRYGLSHFYAPVKKVGTQLLSTMSFNISLLWTFSAFLYLLLLTEAPSNILKLRRMKL